MDVKKIVVVSNTHWDREFRQSFEKTRRNLLTMLGTTLDILQKDKEYHSFTMDGHAIMIDDYLEMCPERLEQVKQLVSEGRLIIGPYYTLAEQFSISHEALVRNLMFGRKTVEKYGGKTGTVAYTPSSWGQTGQYPQILKDFGLDKMMFYRGISHHEADAEYIWQAPDGTKMLASRFALYCRYNWYYQVHRGVSRGKVFDKNYSWGEQDEAPFRLANAEQINGTSYELTDPAQNYDPTNLETYIEDMLKEEDGHFTTSVFLAMNGHDISVAFPRESEVIKDAQKIFADKYEIKHGDLESFWKEAKNYLKQDEMTILTGERRSYLKEGKWTFLFPGTISARTYLKQQDFNAYTNLTYFAEPLSALAYANGGEYRENYLQRGWQYLLSNHTHDANGGCAPDAVCKDMEYRYRKVLDIGDIVTTDAMSYLAKNLSSEGQSEDVMQVVVYNPLPFARDVITEIDLEVPKSFGGKGVEIENTQLQLISSEKSSVFMDSIWEVPTILDSTNYRVYARFTNVPACGYKTYQVKAAKHELRKKAGIVTDDGIMENECLKATVNQNATVSILNKKTGKLYENLNYFTSEGEVGNAWKHVTPEFDSKYHSLGVNCRMATTLNGELAGTITCEFDFQVPLDCPANRRSDQMANIPIKVDYTLQQGSDSLLVKVTLNNTAKDHWLRVNMPTGIDTDVSIADSHFDVVKRPVAVPDSTGWVEQAFGTHPLRTFAAACDSENGIAVMPKGLFEYELFENKTLALTLIRACRIRLAVSEEKMTELADEGVQCQGINHFEYAININDGDYSVLANKAAELNAGVKCAAAGRGKGDLPLESSLFAIDNRAVHVTAVKKAESGNGIIVRLYNTMETEQTVSFTFGKPVCKILLCRMDESVIEECQATDIVPAKKIRTYYIEF